MLLKNNFYILKSIMHLSYNLVLHPSCLKSSLVSVQIVATFRMTLEALESPFYKISKFKYLFYWGQIIKHYRPTPRLFLDTVSEFPSEPKSS